MKYLLAIMGVSSLFICPAFTHDATSMAGQPLGWKYPWQCCSNMDCRNVGGGVVETPDGYRIQSTGEIIPYRDKRIKDSPDQDFHWCAHQAGLDKDHTICLFVPGKGS